MSNRGKKSRVFEVIEPGVKGWEHGCVHKSSTDFVNYDEVKHGLLKVGIKGN